MTGESIMIRCEGSLCPANQRVGELGRCAMCGRFYPLIADIQLPDHERDDILARIARGDFG